MAIEKKIFVDQVEVTSSGAVQVRTATHFIENGETVSRSFHRHVVAPGDSYSNEEEKVKNMCYVVHTADVINAYKQQLSIIKT